MIDKHEPVTVVVDRSQGFGERLLGQLVDRAHQMPPHMIAPLIAQEIAMVGGRDVEILLQDYDQKTLLALPGEGLVAGPAQLIEGSSAGRAFQTDIPVEEPDGDGVRVFTPLLDGTGRIGVMAFTVDSVNDLDRRLTRRLAGLIADILVTKNMYTDWFFKARRQQPLSLSAEMQWHLLPPLMMTTQQVSVAGALEPAYDAAGDSFDYALNDDVLHVAMIDAMGHGLGAAVMATLVVGAYRHARRLDIDLEGMYLAMDEAMSSQFTSDQFATAQLARLDVLTGRMTWINAGHPPPLLLRGNRVVAELDSPTTLPVGFGGAKPVVTETMLERGDRVLFFTDGVVEKQHDRGEQFSEARLRELVEWAGQDDSPVQETVRRLSHALMHERGDITRDDSTLLLLEWRGGTLDPLQREEEPIPTPG